METKTLDRAWVVNGNRYGPGDVTVGSGGQMPEADAKALAEKGAFGDIPMVEPAANQRAPLIDQTTHPDDAAQVSARSSDDDVFTEAQGQALADAGYDTPEKMRAITDEQLNQVPGIGAATIQRFRARVGAPLPPPDLSGGAGTPQ